MVRCGFSLERAILLMLEWQDHIIRTFLSGDIFRSMIFHKGLANWKMSCVMRCVLSLEWAVLLKLEWRDHIIRTFLSGNIFTCITVVRWGNSTKTISLYSPHPNVTILVTDIRTFLSVDIYMTKVAYMFAFS